jgi:colanic acid/amylovoran biosynthesis glycosyltransferase
MRVAFVADFPSVSETFVLREITGLLDRAHDVEIFPPRAATAAVVHPQIARYRLLDRTHPPEARDLALGARAARALGIVARFGVRDPLPVARSLDLVRYGRRAASLRLLLEVEPMLARGRFDIVYAHFGPNGLRVLDLQRLGVLAAPLVTTFHGYDMSMYVEQHGPGVYAELFARGARFLPISDRWRHRLIELGCPPERITVHRMGVEPGRLPVRAPDAPWPRGGPLRLLSIARLVEKKGIEYGIRAVAELARSGDEVEYRIIGDGPLAEPLAALATELGVQRQVALLGARDEAGVAEALAWCDALVCPSVTARNGDAEGIPVVLMEAMGSGIPVVSTNHSGIPELVVPGETGRLAPERDAGALAREFRAMRDDPGGTLRMAHAGRRRVLERHDAERLVAELETIFVEVAAGARA